MAVALTQCGTGENTVTDAGLDAVETTDLNGDRHDAIANPTPIRGCGGRCSDGRATGRRRHGWRVDAKQDGDTDDAGDVKELPPYDEPPVRVLFDLLGAQVESPFPSNHYIDPETGTIRIASNGYNNSLLYLIEMDFPTYAQDAARAEGFALYSALAFLTSTAVDPESIPATGQASLQPDSSVKLFRIDGETPVKVAIHCAFKRFEESRTFNLTQCFPLYRLEADATYLFVVSNDLKDIDGNAFARSRGFMQALGLARVEVPATAERLELMRHTGQQVELGMSGLPADAPADDMVAATVFSTGHPNVDMEDVMKNFRQDAPMPTVEYELDEDGEGNPRIFTGSTLPGCSMPDADMEWGLHGYFTAPEFRNTDGHFERDGDGNFRTFPGERIRFTLMVPEGDGPFPVVIAQHGVSSTESAMCNFGRELVRRDVAVMRFLWPGHGGDNERGNGTTDFLDVLNPARIAYNFMQSATEIASAVILLDKLNQDLAGLRPEGDGLPPLDTGRIGYVGTSLGSIIGLLYLPFSDRINILVSNVGGLGMSHLVKQFVDEYFGGIYVGSAVTNLADHIVAPATASRMPKDPAEPVEWASGPKYVLAQEVIGDAVIANACTEVLARNAGLKLVNPVAVPVEGLESDDPEKPDVRPVPVHRNRPPPVPGTTKATRREDRAKPGVALPGNRPGRTASRNQGIFPGHVVRKRHNHSPPHGKRIFTQAGEFSFARTDGGGSGRTISAPVWPLEPGHFAAGCSEISNSLTFARLDVFGRCGFVSPGCCTTGNRGIRKSCAPAMKTAKTTISPTQTNRC